MVEVQGAGAFVRHARRLLPRRSSWTSIDLAVAVVKRPVSMPDLMASSSGRGATGTDVGSTWTEVGGPPSV